MTFAGVCPEVVAQVRSEVLKQIADVVGKVARITGGNKGKLGHVGPMFTRSQDLGKEDRRSCGLCSSSSASVLI